MICHGILNSMGCVDYEEESEGLLDYLVWSEERQKKKQRKTVEELRAERLKREEQEQQKAQKLVVAQLRVRDHHGADRAGQPYYNQSYGNARWWVHNLLLTHLLIEEMVMCFFSDT
jgi:hypothetical protein